MINLFLFCLLASPRLIHAFVDDGANDLATIKTNSSTVSTTSPPSSSQSTVSSASTTTTDPTNSTSNSTKPFHCTFPATNLTSHMMPVVLPPFYACNRTELKIQDIESECNRMHMLYMESLVITIFQNGTAKPIAADLVIQGGKHNSTWDSFLSINCTNLNLTVSENSTENANLTEVSDKNANHTRVQSWFSFTVNITTGEDVTARQKNGDLFTIETNTSLIFILHFKTILGYGWDLDSIETASNFSIIGGLQNGNLTVTPNIFTDKKTVDKMKIVTYNGYNYACSATKIAIFNQSATPGYELGISFRNLQIQRFNRSINGTARFTMFTTDCVDTFSPGSLMGIIVALILATTLFFAIFMLGSVDSPDRFDDPKGRHLMINCKD